MGREKPKTGLERRGMPLGMWGMRLAVGSLTTESNHPGGARGGSLRRLVPARGKSRDSKDGKDTREKKRTPPQTLPYTGNVTTTSSPPSGRFLAVMPPPCSSATRRAIGSPRPVPVSWVEK